MSKDVLKISGLAVVVVLLTVATSKMMNAGPPPAADAIQQPVRPLITSAIDENNLVTLARNTRPEANAKNDRGRLSDDFVVEHVLLQLQRSPEQERALEKYIDSLNNKKSPNFHKWLTAEEFGQRYGLAQEDLDAITGWLKSHGFVVNTVYPNRVLIDFSGTAGMVREALHAELHQLSVHGENHISNMSDPRIPAALAPAVMGVFSLNDFKPHAMYRPKADYSFGGCSTLPTNTGTCYAITPQDTQTIYNLFPLYNAGISGQGQTIVLVEDTDTYSGAGDWNLYRKTFGLARNATYPVWNTGTYTQVHPGCTDPGTNGDDGEAAIDVEVATAVAPAAAVELVSCPSTTFTFGGVIALQNLINESSTPPAIVSVSYGACEEATAAGGNAFFYNTYQQAAGEGVSVFVSSGDEGPSSCSNEFGISTYDITSLGVTGWGETPYNVSVGGTDFEDTYNVKEAGASFSTYWGTNTPSYGSALKYVPEIPWNDACASALIAEYENASFTTSGSTGFCNKAPGNTTYLIAGGASGGASNCATGAAGADQTSDLVVTPQCQGYAKPSFQSGSSLTGGKAVYGQPSDGVRDIPDVSLFAANGIWGHYEVVCWSDPTQTSGGAVACTGAPSTWSGFGGTSVASPTMAAMQALVNQKTAARWGNPNSIYYQIAQNEYGTVGGTFQGSSCNSSGSGGPASSCVFNDITQGDIDLACEDNGSLQESHCYKPSGTHGVDSTDNVTAAAVINGGTGYTTAPTCTIAGPTNSSPYLSPTATTLWAGGTQAKCTATVTATSTTAKWTLVIENATAAGQQLTVSPGCCSTVGGTSYTLTGASTTAICSALAASINTGSLATATCSGSTVTATAKTAGYAGDFNVTWGTGFLFGDGYVQITDTTVGQGPNYVSGITVTTAGTGYQPDTPITLTGGGGTGAVAVANTSIGTAAQSYQPAYGAAPGYDLATGLGSVNAYNLVMSNVW